MSSSSSTSSVVGDRGFPAKCVCGLGVKIYTSKTQENPGRRFFRCISKREGHLFKWVEDAMYEEIADSLSRVAIIGNELSKAKSEQNELNGVIDELKEEAVLCKKEIGKLELCFRVCFVWLCLISIVIIYMSVST